MPATPEGAADAGVKHDLGAMSAIDVPARTGVQLQGKPDAGVWGRPGVEHELVHHWRPDELALTYQALGCPLLGAASLCTTSIMLDTGAATAITAELLSAGGF